VPENFRYATEYAVINGFHVPEGTYISINSARPTSPRNAPRARRISNSTGRRLPHLTFGKGPHFCIGQRLARAEIEETLRALRGLVPESTPEGPVESHVPRSISGRERIPMSYSASACASQPAGECGPDAHLIARPRRDRVIAAHPVTK
jgi:cytochrome P450